MFMGYTLAVLSILGTAKIAVALLVLAVPIIDAFWIIVRRTRPRSLAVLAGPRPPPPSAARRGPVAPPDGAADLRDLHRARGAVAAAVGRGPVYAFLGVFVADRPRRCSRSRGSTSTTRTRRPRRERGDSRSGTRAAMRATPGS